MKDAEGKLKKIHLGVMESLNCPKGIDLTSVEDVRKLYGSPVTQGVSESTRLAMDEQYNGYETIYGSLTQHAMELGQFPMTSFLGYGVLQAIAQNGMIRACVQTVADDMTREWVEIVGGDDTDHEKLIRLNKVQETKYKLRSIFNRAFSTMGYMGGAFIYIDTGAEDPSIPLVINENSAEFEKGKKVKFVVVDPISVAPCEYNASDPLKEDFMRPQSWYVLGRRVHGSRLVTLRDNVPPILLSPNYNFLGIPQAQILWDYVLHWNKARVAACDLLEKLNFMVFKTDAMQYLSAPDGLAQLDAKVEVMNRYRSNESVFVCDAETEDVQNVVSQIGGVTDVVKQALEFIASINRTPAVKLLGISPAGFNATGESDIRNYYDHIRSKQEKFKEQVLRCVKAIQLCEYGEIDNSIGIEFRELGKEDEAQKVATANAKAQYLTGLQDHQVMSAEEVRDIVKADKSMGLDSLDDEVPEELKQAQAMAQGDPSAMQEQVAQAMAEQKQPQAEYSNGNETEDIEGDRAERGEQEQVQEDARANLEKVFL